MALLRGFSYSQFRGAFLGVFGPFVTVAATIPSTAAGANGTITVAVPGLVVNDIVLSIVPATNVAGVAFSGNVQAANVLTIVAENGSVGAYNPGPQTFTVILLRPKLA
jgi:hypothetical protein